ncbi:TPA: hypothetical protein N0F65_012219 [Lagenidium giganteum]|uniref:Transmembrane protein n=1 Tax=Lagenidium giganteum TaxID=4803 RepID=A0AAV2ZEK1_9STRA|nr:TPA: hypothetical protein N0F65_012219 [Lagenidium giganteum]
MAMTKSGHRASRWLLANALVVGLLAGTPYIIDNLPKAPYPPSQLKPYDSLAAFRPHYQREHQNSTSVNLHVIGTSLVVLLALMHPELILGGIAAVRCGQIAFMLSRHQNHGLAEFLAMLTAYLGTVRLVRGSLRTAVLTLIVGYAFAWVGHFFHEMNRPATFIYPTFSLMCDFLMWAERVTGISINVG